MSDAHSKFSASASDRWMGCPGSMVLSVNAERKSSSYAAWGTLAHDLAAKHLADGFDVASALGQTFTVDGYDIAVDSDMVDCIASYAETVRDYQGDGVLLVEQQVCYADYLGLGRSLAWGTADAIIARDDELVVIDLKTGMGVEVNAENNSQMSLYALGALATYQGVAGEFVRVRMVISQPRIRKAPSEWDISVADLEAWGRGAARSAAASCINASNSFGKEHRRAEWEQTFLRPAEKSCKWCPAKATCPALRDAVTDTVFNELPASADEFADLTATPPISEDGPAWLAAALSKCDMIEDWCKAVRAEVERRLLAGDKVPGYKVVQGKRGARQWADAEAAEKLLRETFRLKVEEAYDLKLISPTTAEKLHKAGAIGPRQWPKAQALITQREGAPHVAPVSDPRPALDVRPVADDFEALA